VDYGNCPTAIGKPTKSLFGSGKGSGKFSLNVSVSVGRQDREVRQDEKVSPIVCAVELAQAGTQTFKGQSSLFGLGSHRYQR